MPGGLEAVLDVALAMGYGALLVVAGCTDVRRYRIPNEVSLALLLIFVVAALRAIEPVAWTGHLITGAGLWLAGFAIWRLGWLGAGDVKLFAVLGVWAGPQALGALVLNVTLAGGGLALVVAAYRWAARLRTTTPEAQLERLPYGVALACGGLVTAPEMPALAVL